MSKITLFFLGLPRLLRDGVVVEPDTRKAVALLAYLTITGQAHTRDTLAALLYPDYDESHARGALRRTLSSLNKAVGAGNLSVSRESVALVDSPSVWVDVRQFESTLSLVDRHAHTSLEACADCLANLEACAVLYRGDFLAGFSLRDSLEFDDWKFFQGENLRRRFSSVLERLARSYRLRNQTDQGIEVARRWLSLDPLSEDSHRELMRSYAQAGQRNAALRQYKECARILEKELGVEPLEETRELYRAILEYRYQTFTLPVSSEPPLPSKPALSTTEPTGPHNFPLIGRDEPWSAVIEAYQNRASQGYFIALEGEPGIGKTRLAEELIALAARQGAVTITARCFEGESGLAYASMIELLRSAVNGPAAYKLESIARPWLGECARLLTDLRQRYPDLPEPQPLSSLGAQSVFFEGFRQTVYCLASGAAPGIIFFDDAQWADSASLDLLAYLIRRISGHAILMLVAWRDDDLPAQVRLRSLLAESKRAGSANGLHLERLKVEDVVEMTRRATNRQGNLPSSFNKRLFQESEGLPLVLVEYLDAFLEQSPAEGMDDESHAGEIDWQAPDGARNLFLRRIAALDELSRQMIAAAAVIGRSFDFETLAAATGRNEADTLAGLETLASHGIVQECGSCDDPALIRYDFTHEMLRSLVYDEISLARRRSLHARVGDTLAKLTAKSPAYGILSGQIAGHYRLAGDNASAARYFRLAADEARRLFANRQALELYQSAVALNPDGSVELLTQIGDLYTLLGEYDAALEAYRRGVSLASSTETARLAHKIGNVYQRRGEWSTAIEQYRQASAANPPLPEELAVRCLADWSLTLVQMGRMDEAEKLAKQALQRAETGAATLPLAQAHNLLGILLRRRKEHEAAHTHLQKSLDLGVKLGDEALQTAALNNLALLLEETGDLTTAFDYTQKALYFCEKLGDRHRAAALHNHLADLYQHSGQTAMAMEHLKKAVIIFAEIGRSEDEIQPEIWKLTEW